MKKGNAIEVKNITKQFRVYLDKGNTLKEKTLFRKRRKYEDRLVLDGISFEVRKGEAIGLIGHNGCGKSTTLKLLTKIMYPDAGSIEMAGRVSSLIELGAGFHPDMSGRENIYINAAIFGLNRKEIDSRLEQIIDFSELREFIDNPVRTYSSGMYMRLAFSVAINVDADILLIDEILAVGDAHFQEKCFDKLKEIKRGGTTIIIVSHSLGQIEEICDRSIWIDKGKIKKEGIPCKVHEEYLDFMNIRKKIDPNDKKQKEKNRKQEEVQKNFKRGNARIQNIYVRKPNGAKKRIYTEGEEIEINFEYKIDEYIQEAELNVALHGDVVECRGTDIYNLAKSEKRMELREADWLYYLVASMNQEENLIPRMYINEHCDRNADEICIRNRGIMWGPCLSVPPLNYKLYVEIDCSGMDEVIMNITKDMGQVKLRQVRLLNGENVIKLQLEEEAENLEFVINNPDMEDIIVKKIVMI